MMTDAGRPRHELLMNALRVAAQAGADDALVQDVRDCLRLMLGERSACPVGRRYLDEATKTWLYDLLALDTTAFADGLRALADAVHAEPYGIEYLRTVLACDASRRRETGCPLGRRLSIGSIPS